MKKQKTKTGQAFPGYPHYNSSEDITSKEKNANADVEKLSSTGGKVKAIKRTEADLKENEEEELLHGENDITKDDLKILGERDEDMDGGEDETLIPKVKMNADMMGGDLDVPGNDDDEEESEDGKIGHEDEENNLYSKGQD